MSGLAFLRRDNTPGKRLPSAPAADMWSLYLDADGNFQVLDSDGTATDLLSFIGALGMAQQSADAVAVTGGSGRFTTGLGFNTGAGGTVVQSSSKATTVTLDKHTGKITMNAATLNADTTVSFTLNNSQVEAEDQLVVSHHSGGTAGSYTVGGRATGAGTATVVVRNITGGNLGEAIVLKFSVIKGVAA